MSSRKTVRKMVHEIVHKTAARPASQGGVASGRAATATATKPAAGNGAPANGMLFATRPKNKLVRDSFTMPKSDYLLLDGLKLRAVGLARPVKKSELLRAGIAALHAMSDRNFLAALNKVPALKTGRPKNPEPAVGKANK